MGTSPIQVIGLAIVDGHPPTELVAEWLHLGRQAARTAAASARAAGLDYSSLGEGLREWYRTKADGDELRRLVAWLSEQPPDTALRSVFERLLVPNIERLRAAEASLAFKVCGALEARGIFISHVILDLWRLHPKAISDVGVDALINRWLTSRLAKDRATAATAAFENPGDLLSQRQRTRILETLSRDTSQLDHGDSTVGGLSLGYLASMSGSIDKGDDVCLVLMPFGHPYDDYYDLIFAPAAAAAGLSPVRADEIYGVGAIIDDIMGAITNARVLIAELSDRNPNVLYEVGAAHALNKSVVLVSHRMDDVPFDVRHLRFVTYDTTGVGWDKKLQNRIQETLKVVLSAK